MTSILPPYSPSPSAPSYSREPAHDEERIQLTPPMHVRSTGTYTKKCGNDTVVLTEQDCGAEFPKYGRQASIDGFVTFEDRETVCEIVLKLKGKMDTMSSEGGALTTRLIDNSYTVWASSGPLCPSAVPFSVALPKSFVAHDRLSRPLPPSYEIPMTTIPGIYFKASYTLSVTITRTVSRKLRFQTKSKSIRVPFIYKPRLRPYRPIVASTDFLTDVKAMPEEFRQASSQLQPAPKSKAEPLDLHLFLPAVEIFGLDDTIPFHVQLSGSVSSLRQFLPTDTKATITGSLVRQITVDINGRRTTRQVLIGDAKMIPRPPGATASADEISLDWDGEVQARADTMVGMFDAGCVRLQDFILIELKPLDVEVFSQYVTLRHSHAIRLVSESWAENSLARDDPR
ncbi:hypothetical protein R3P38DRAFT_2524578 [Favolaschia claudopus]|uniref:Arrestin-like N-terminal domain-containing protein n=1 Tax=Favolaschia claudopus TaxID=2862362 RepID=A0AAW0BTJ4_9AGAR